MKIEANEIELALMQLLQEYFDTRDDQRNLGDYTFYGFYVWLVKRIEG